MENNSELIAEQFRQAAGIGKEAQHVDELDEVPAANLATEPEDGYGGADGDPDTTNVGGGRPAFQSDRLAGDDKDQEDIPMSAGPKEDGDNEGGVTPPTENPEGKTDDSGQADGDKGEESNSKPPAKKTAAAKK